MSGAMRDYADSNPGMDLLEAARSAGLRVPETPVEPESRIVEVNGLRLRYLDWGNGHLPDLLLLHGTAQDAHSWDFAALSLSDRFHVVALDQRGHGESEWHTGGDYGLSAYLADLEAFVEAAGLRDIVVCGLSMGGRNAYAYSASRPDRVRALVVTEAAPRMEDPGRERVTRFVSGPREFDSFEELVAHVHAYVPERPVEQLRGSLRHKVRRFSNGKWSWKYDPEIVRARRGPFADTEDDRWRLLAGVSCPTLFVLGERSDMISRATLDRMLDTVPGSRAEVVPDAGHLAPGDNPAGFDAAIRPFLEGLG
ncbi:MAG: alpha/beta fold hydrolase [Chloroflexota bacterium]